MVPKPKHRRRTRKRPAAFTEQTRQEVWDRQDGECWLCRRGITEFHHAYPRALGGTSRPELGESWNCIGLCTQCHRDVEASRELRERLRQAADAMRTPTNEVNF